MEYPELTPPTGKECFDWARKYGLAEEFLARMYEEFGSDVRTWFPMAALGLVLRYHYQAKLQEATKEYFSQYKGLHPAVLEWIGYHLDKDFMEEVFIPSSIAEQKEEHD